MQPEELIREYISNNKVLQLATVDKGKPRICNLHYAFDDSLNFYWLSSRHRNHSVSLRNNKHTAVSILHSPDKKQCIHIEGEAHELSVDEDIKKAHEIYGPRYGQKPERLVEAQSGDPKTRAYYIFKPNLIVLFDEKNFPEDPRKEFKP